MSQNVRKWLILSDKIYLQAKIWVILPFPFWENLRKCISAIYRQNHKLHIQPFIGASFPIAHFLGGLIKERGLTLEKIRYVKLSQIKSHWVTFNKNVKNESNWNNLNQTESNWVILSQNVSKMSQLVNLIDKPN